MDVIKLGLLRLKQLLPLLLGKLLGAVTAAAVLFVTVCPVAVPAVPGRASAALGPGLNLVGGVLELGIDGILHRGSCRSDAADDCRRSALGVADQVHTLNRGAHRFTVGNRPAFLIQRQPEGLQQVRIAALSGGGDQKRAVQDKGSAGLYRAPSARSVRLPQFHHAALEHAVPESLRIGKETKYRTLCQRVFVLLPVGRHFLGTSAVNDGDALCAGQSQCRPGTVHGGVASAADYDVSADSAAGGVLGVCGKEFKSPDDRQPAFIVQLYEVVLRCSDRVKDIVETLILQSLYSLLLVPDVEAEFNPRFHDVVDIGLHSRSGNPELGDDPLHHSAGIRCPFQDGDSETGPGEEIRRRETGRSGSDNCRLDIRQLGFRLEPGIIGRRALFNRDLFHIADSDCALVVHPAAVLLTLMVTDGTGDVGQGIVLINQLQGLGVHSPAGQIDVVRNILMNRTGILARSREAIEHLQFGGTFSPVRTSEFLLLTCVGHGTFTKRPQSIGIDTIGIPPFALPDKQFYHPGHPGVPARLEHIGGQRYRPDARVKQILHGEYIGSSGVRNRKLSRKLFRKQGAYPGRNRKQGPSAHVHLRPGQLSLVVDRTEGVGQLHPESQSE